MAQVSQKSRFVCSSCGARSNKWQGRCFVCGQFGTLEEEKEGRKVGNEKAFTLDEIGDLRIPRLKTGFQELDRVLGGGIVKGSTILLAGEPGLGKTTLLLQLGGRLFSPQPILYISAEESPEQIKMHIRRLQLPHDKFFIASYTSLDEIEILIEKYTEEVSLIIIDSIQTVYNPEISSGAGSVTQVRENARRLVNLCKKLKVPLILVGHVTKTGLVAGPKTLEHLVDVVLYLEGDKATSWRFIRGIKNRFGSVLELGLFQIGEQGLEEGKEWTLSFSSRQKSLPPGTVITVALEGLRPLVLEVQALTVLNPWGKPLRNVTGLSHKRLLMLLAVLQKHGKINLSRHDVFVNLAGGVKIIEPGLDLAICLALASSFKNKALVEGKAAFGEISLSGELKEVKETNKRKKALGQIGFRDCFYPPLYKSLGQVLTKAFA